MDKNNRRRILFLVDGFNVGGAELNLLKMLGHADRERHDFVLLSFRDQGPLRPRFEAMGIPVTLMCRRWRFDLSVPFRLYRFLQRGRYDVVVTVLFYPDILGTLMGWLARVPVRLAWETASHHDTFFHPWHRRFMYRRVMPLTTRILTVSEEGRQSIIQVERLRPEKIAVLPAGVEVDRFVPRSGGLDRQSLDLDDGDLVLGVVARLDPIKGHAFLLEALARVRAQAASPRLRCLFIGDGPERQKLEAQAEALGLSDTVRFLGFRDDVPALLPLLDLFVLPSISEGLPNVILEAMAAGVPLAASAVGGIPEVVESGRHGWLFPSGDVDALADRLQQAMNDPLALKKMGAEARAHVVAHYSMAAQIRTFEALYRLGGAADLDEALSPRQ